MVLALASTVGRSSADVVDGGFERPIVNQSNWTGPSRGSGGASDELGRWYGSDFTTVSAAAAAPQLPTKNQSRSLVQGLPMPPSGTYKLSLDVRFTSGPDQQIYWHVLGVEEGVTLRLTNNGIPRSVKQSGVKSLWLGHVHNHQDKERWFTYDSSFWVSPEDTKRFAYLVVAIVGITPRGCISEFDNVVTNVPYAPASGDTGITVEWYSTPQSISSLRAIDWTSPFMTTTEPAINWSNRTTPFREGVPSDYFGLRARGFLVVPTTGLWTFELGSDDGSRLLIDGRTVIDHDRLQSFRKQTGQIELEAGQIPIEVTFFEKTGHQGLVLSWRGPGEKVFKAIEPSDLSTTPSQAPPRRARIVRWTETATIDE